MSTLTVSTLVKAPIERVFSVFTHLERAPEHIPGITALEVLTEGPFGVGTRWRETRIFLKKEATEEMWVTACEPPKGYSVEAESHGMRYSTDFTFEPSDGGTRVTWTFDSIPLTFGTRLMSPLFGFLMKRTMNKCMLSDLEALGAVCESDEGDLPAQEA